MAGKSKYYLVRDKALPEVLQKVIEVKRLLTSEKSLTVQDAAQRAGLSRSSFYKYKDDIVPFSDNTMGKTTHYRANILTIHQAIPVNGVATVTLSVEVLADTGDVDGLVEEIENLTGIYDLRILGIEKG